LSVGTAPTATHPKRLRWLSQAQAAEYLGITDRTLRRMVARGEVRGHRLGPRLTRFDQGDLDAALRPIPAGGEVA
jgi:excisionase family DNA binding protein